MKHLYKVACGYGIVNTYANDGLFLADVIGPKVGDLYYNSTAKSYRYYDGITFRRIGLDSPAVTTLNAIATWGDITGASLANSSIEIDAGGNLLWSIDNVSNLGNSAGNRPAIAYIGTELHIGGADASAAFSVSSTTKGLLPPRMTTVERDAIVAPTTGLLIYNTDLNEYEFYNVGVWSNFLAGLGGAYLRTDGANAPITDIGWSGYGIFGLSSLYGTNSQTFTIAVPDGGSFARPPLLISGGNAYSGNWDGSDVTIRAGLHSDPAYTCILAINPSLVVPSADPIHWEPKSYSTWASLISYTAGSATIYNGTVYQCTSDIGPLAPSSDPIHWSIVPTWVSGNGYVLTDTVEYLGDVYICILAINPSLVDPSSDPIHWTPLTVAVWSSATSYNANDIASDSGVPYICILAVAPPTAPPTDPAHWSTVSAWVSGSAYVLNNVVTDHISSIDGKIYLKTQDADRVVVDQDITLTPDTGHAVIVNGKLTVTGVIDPTALLITNQGSVPSATAGYLTISGTGGAAGRNLFFDLSSAPTTGQAMTYNSVSGKWAPTTLSFAYITQDGTTNKPTADMDWASHKLINCPEIDAPTSSNLTLSTTFANSTIVTSKTLQVGGAAATNAWLYLYATDGRIISSNTMIFDAGAYGQATAASQGVFSWDTNMFGLSKPLTWPTDNTYDIGSHDSGTTLRRPRRVYIGTSILMSGTSIANTIDMVGGTGLSNGAYNQPRLVLSDFLSVGGSTSVPGLYMSGVYSATTYHGSVIFVPNTQDIQFTYPTGVKFAWNQDGSMRLTSSGDIWWITDGSGDIGRAWNRPANIRIASTLEIGTKDSVAEIGTIRLGCDGSANHATIVGQNTGRLDLTPANGQPVYINGKLTVTGVIDPTALLITNQGSVPAATAGYLTISGTGGAAGQTMFFDFSTPPTNGQGLVYNNVSGKWAPGAAGAAFPPAGDLSMGGYKFTDLLGFDGPAAQDIRITPAAGTGKVQTITFSAVPSGGTWNLSVNYNYPVWPNTTSGAYSVGFTGTDNAATVQSKILQQAPFLGTNGVTVTGDYTVGFTVTFNFAMGNSCSLVSLSTGSLTPGGITGSINNITTGVTGKVIAFGSSDLQYSIGSASTGGRPRYIYAQSLQLGTRTNEMGFIALGPTHQAFIASDLTGSGALVIGGNSVLLTGDNGTHYPLIVGTLATTFQGDSLYGDSSYDIGYYNNSAIFSRPRHVYAKTSMRIGTKSGDNSGYLAFGDKSSVSAAVANQLIIEGQGGASGSVVHVDLSTAPTDKQVLGYDSASTTWKAQTVVTVYSAYITAGGSPTASQKYPYSWIDSVVQNSTGNYTINITSGIFTSAPNIVVTVQRNAAIIPVWYVRGAPSTSAITIQVEDSAGAAQDWDFMVMAQGI